MGGEPSNDFMLRIILDLQEQTFDIFTGCDNEPIISLHPSSTIHKDSLVSQTFDTETEWSQTVSRFVTFVG